MADNSDTRLTTGVEELDRELNEGLLPGSVVALTAPANSQTEVMFEELARTRPTVVLSAYRTKEQVLNSFKRGGVETSGKAVKALFVGESNNPIQKAVNVSGQMSGVGNIIIDSVDYFEETHTRDEYLSGLRELKDNISDAGGMALLHCHEGQSQGLRNLTYAVADVIMVLNQDIEGEEIEIRLAIPKYRGAQPPKETIKLRIADDVSVDTSRDIA